MSSQVNIIEATGVSKKFEIYSSPRDRLQQLVVQPWRRALGLQQKKYFQEFYALEDISFSVQRGETVGIIGRNGSGKSTLLQLVCNVLSPSSGHIKTYGRISALLELGSGFNPEFSGRENVLLYGAILGLSRKDMEEQYESIVRFADIGDFVDQPVKVYSSGMIMRLAFATAIHVQPDILVVDEALSVGDTAFQQKCLNRIREMQRDGVSILLVTHSNNTLVEYCDRGIFLKNGRLIMDGPCRDVVKAYAEDLVSQEGGSTIELAVDALHANKPVVENAKAKEPAMALRIASVQLLDENGTACSNLLFQQKIFVNIEVEAASEIVQPCFGIQLTSVDGITLWSATTQSMDIPLLSIKQGVSRFVWALQANFSGGRYVVAVGVGHVTEGEYKRLHRLDYAGHFDVQQEPKSGSGWLAPRPEFMAVSLVESKTL
jgi:lipopolysaccharide transport system ATP-binding protein